MNEKIVSIVSIDDGEDPIGPPLTSDEEVRMWNDLATADPTPRQGHVVPLSELEEQFKNLAAWQEEWDKYHG